jgi:hypothetical protein
MKKKVKNILITIHFEDFVLVFDEWKCRMHECIDIRDEYF